MNAHPNKIVFISNFIPNITHGLINEGIINIKPMKNKNNPGYKNNQFGLCTNKNFK